MKRLQPSRMRAQEVEGAGDVEVADIDVPVFVGLQRLHEAGAFFGEAWATSRPGVRRL